MITLHGVLLSPYMARLWLQLRHKKKLDAVRWEGIPGNRLGGPEHVAVNPLGRIPYAVLDDGTVLPESHVIAHYFERLYPEPGLIPADPEQAAQVDLICRLLDLYILPEVIMLTRMLGQPNAREQGHMDAAVTAIGHLEHFFTGQTYAVGEQMSLADCALLPFLFFMHMVRRDGGMDLLADAPKLTAYETAQREGETLPMLMDQMQASLVAVRAARKALEQAS